MQPPTSWQRARVTLGLVLATGIAFVAAALLGLSDWAIMAGGFVPARAGLAVEGILAPFWLTPLTATLVHANAIHLAFNLIILAFCGRPTETVLGPAGFAGLYVAGAYGAAAAQYLAGPSELTPMIGASGAISAVLGAYAMLFGRNKVKIASPRLALLVNALWLMAAWVILQLIVGFGFGAEGLSIAVAAHIGGFLVGITAAKPLLLLRYRRA